MGPSWRGRLVDVCTPDCITPRARATVRLIDSCDCGRVVDLYAIVFGQLASLSSGVLDVTVEW